MHTLTWEEIDDILVGATIMGCGGGGELAEGRELMRSAYEEGRAVTLAGPRELPDEALVACPYGVGGLTVGDEAAYEGLPWSTEHPGVLAVRALGEHLGREFGALITGELGGTSIADAFYPAAMLGLPVVDADPVGRAVPEIEQSLFNLYGVPIAPQAVVNELGDTVIITVVADDRRAEALVRALAVASRNLVWVADHALPWGRMKDIVIPGAISLSRDVGRAFRQAAAAGEDTAAAAAAAGGGGVLFRGRVSAFSWEEKDGFTWGEVEIAGQGADAGAAYRVWFKNENLMAWRDGAPDVTAPDLICCFSGETGQPITNPHHEVGRAVTVVGLPAAAAWRTEHGVAVLGPRHFGFAVDYRPVDNRLRAG
ncbi:MAG: DUF917 domain-containing protein [Actinobacteria bacterium]|nr:DUF917 domain-containing protein [Actinomycetota bacterium]